MSSSSDSQVAERDPTGQYVRYDELLGEGKWKRVYKGFDEFNGIEIAWSVVVVRDILLYSASDIWHLIAEAELMKLLDHENIAKCYHFWIDYENSKLHLITEFFSSETLLHYIVKHGPVNHTSIKNWCRQILEGLDYLHTLDPPIAHRDVKLMNIFVDGNSGIVKLGDFCSAKLIEPGSREHSYYGSSPFIAPEIYRGNYNEMVDIYGFGMCVLVMITREIPYTECRNQDEFYAKVKNGVKPDILNNVTDPQIKQFLEMCFAPASIRPTAIELLNHPFLAVVSQAESSTSQAELSVSQVTSAQVDGLMQVVKEMKCGDKIFKLQGSKKRNVIAPMSLSISYNVENKMKFEYPMAIETGNIDEFVKEKIATQMNLTTEDGEVATEIIKELRTELLSQPNTVDNQKLMSEELSDYNIGNLFAENPSDARPTTHEILIESMGDGDEAEAENNNGMLSCLGKLLSSVCSNP
ncbi:probable serine/threonine-protein kinase WNK11 [Spinacia oleracea]|uniref:non-specific serine/threonine protein kinase n=1 Tax=Spinacia oleracea TaxID=3562 RepID=A0A9R0JPN9_SPIOL|nr:probable serine/threonine-protein kinase WNK11 [Spinacia oleracea]